MIKAYLALWERLTETGAVKPTTHIMDNEASTEYKKVIRQNCTIQLVPPNNHRRNLAERAIQTFKSHFIAIIAGVDDSFPMRLWDKLLPQTILTLNLLRQSNAVPSVSAYQYVRGTFDYNKTPLGPMGSAVQRGMLYGTVTKSVNSILVLNYSCVYIIFSFFLIRSEYG